MRRKRDPWDDAARLISFFRLEAFLFGLIFVVLTGVGFKSCSVQPEPGLREAGEGTTDEH